MKLDEIIQTHFHFLLLDGLYRITEIHTEDDPEVFAIVRGKRLVFRFSVENGRQLLAITTWNKWYDIRDVFCILDDAYRSTDNEDFISLAAMLQRNMEGVENVFHVRAWLNTLKQLAHYMSHNAISRPAAVELDTDCKLSSYDKLEQFVRTEFAFLLEDNRYRIVRPFGVKYTYLVLKGSHMQFAFADDKGQEVLTGRPFFPFWWHDLGMIRSLYQENFDRISIQTFLQWRDVLIAEVDQMESLFAWRNVFNTMRRLRKVQRDFAREFRANI